MTPDIAADLFAYFVSARFFERPGDAGRGKQASRRGIAPIVTESQPR